MYSCLEEIKINRSQQNIGDNVYQSLLKNIIQLNLKPGDNLATKDISEKLNVSKSPVRDSLLKLEKEGLVEVFPQRGSIVSKIDLERVNEERFLRTSLEEKALEIFMYSYCQKDILELKEIIEKQEKSLSDKDYLKLIHYDDKFHEKIFERANKVMCWNLIQNMSGHFKRMRILILWENGIAETLIIEHKEMLNLIYQKDFKTSAKLIDEHCSTFMRHEYELVKKYPNFFNLD